MTLPAHGKINCHKCYRSSSDIVCQPHHLWNMRNDPGAWGGTNPEILVLGFSKGSTQANIYQNGKYEDVAFGGAARGRLDEALKRLNLLSVNEHVTEHIENPDSRFAFGSLVRCSLSREGTDGKHATSGQLIVKSFKEIPDVLDNCARKFLANLPDSTKTILMLGVSDAYIDGCYNLLATIYPRLRRINNVAYGDDKRLFVHVTHPSPGNGHFSAWNTGNSKFECALAALNLMGTSSISSRIEDKAESNQSMSSVRELNSSEAMINCDFTEGKSEEKKHMDKIIKISAVGTSGKVAGIEAIAKRDANGKFVLNRKKASTSSSNTNLAENKIYVDTLEEAYNYLQTNQFLINLIYPNGSRALRQLSRVEVEYA